VLALTVAVQVHLGDQVNEVLLSGFLLLLGVFDLGEHLGPFGYLAAAED
jgi:hypothetical protein